MIFMHFANQEISIEAIKTVHQFRLSHRHIVKCECILLWDIVDIDTGHYKNG